jgi:Glycosyltransferase family 92
MTSTSPLQGSPSKPQSYSHPPRRPRPDERNPVIVAAATASPSLWKTLNFVLCGFALGAASTAMFHSVNMPSIKVQLEYADAPHHFRVKNAEQSMTHNIVNPVSIVNEKNTLTDDETDDGVNKEDDDQVKKEREEIQKSLRGEALSSDKEVIEEEPLHASSKFSEVNQGDDDEVKKEHEEIQKNLREEDIPNDKEFIEEVANDSSKDSNKQQYKEAEYIPSEDEPDFSNPGPPPKLQAGEAFASCILIKDDNHWLIEWLAYHWFVMPLRYLIVAVDPDSKTSPVPILQRWKSRNLMTISVWNDTMFMPKKINANPKMFDNNTDLMMHRVRQNNFYFKCMRTFKQRNREWLMLTDTDEYVVPNYASGLYYNITKNIPITKPGSVLTFFKQHHQLTGENHTCSYMPRYMLGNKESEASIVQRHVAKDGFNGTHFLTQRFVYRNPRRM